MLVCLSTKITASIGIFIQLPSLVPVSAPFSCSSPERPLGFLSLSFLLELASWRHQQEIWQLDKSKIPVYIFSCFPSYGDSVDCPGSNTMSQLLSSVRDPLLTILPPWKLLLSFASSVQRRVSGVALLQPQMLHNFLLPQTLTTSLKRASLSYSLLILHSLSVPLFSAGTLSDYIYEIVSVYPLSGPFFLER